MSNYLVRKTTLLISTMLALLSSAAAQQIGYLDLTAGTDAPRVREPEGLGGGTCGGSDHTYYPEILVQLEWLDDTKYSLGEPVKFEVKIQNGGKTPITIPWGTNLCRRRTKRSRDFLHVPQRCRFSRVRAGPRGSHYFCKLLRISRYPGDSSRTPTGRVVSDSRYS